MGFCDTCPTQWSWKWCQDHGPGWVACGHGAACTGMVDTCCAFESYDIEPADPCTCRECAHDGAERGYDPRFQERAILFKEGVEQIANDPNLKKQFERELGAVKASLRRDEKKRKGRRLSTTVDALYHFMHSFVISVADPAGVHGMHTLPCPQRCVRALAALDRVEERGFNNAHYIKSKCPAGTKVAFSGGGGRHDAVLSALGGKDDFAYDSSARTVCVRRAVGASDRKLGVCVCPSPEECWMSDSLATMICEELKAVSRCSNVVVSTNWANPTLGPSSVRLPHYRYFLSTIQRAAEADSLGGLRYRLARHLHALTYLERLGTTSYVQFLADLPTDVAKSFATQAEVESASIADLDKARARKYSYAGSHELTPEDGQRGRTAQSRKRSAKKHAHPAHADKLSRVRANAAKRAALWG